MRIIQLHLFLIGAALITYLNPYLKARSDPELRFAYQEYHLDPSNEDDFNRAVDLTITSDSPFKSLNDLIEYKRKNNLSDKEFSKLRDYYYAHRSNAQIIRDNMQIVQDAAALVLYALGATFLGTLFFIIGVIKKLLRLWAKI